MDSLASRPDDWDITIPDVSPGDEVSGIVDAIDSQELVVFPSGRFTWTEQARVTRDQWGVICQDDTVFEVPVGLGDNEDGEVITTDYRSGIADEFLLQGLTFDAAGRAAPGLGLGVRNTATVTGLEYLMNGPTSDREHENGIRAYVENPDGCLRIDDYYQFNNGDLGGFGGGDSRIGIWVGSENEGTIHLRNPVLQGFPNNACYVSYQPGQVIIDGGLLSNNNVSAVRVSGGVTVRDTTVYLDVDDYLEGPGVLEASAHNTRGLWGDNSGPGADGGLASNVTFIINSYQRCTGLATLFNNPMMTVRDSQFLLNTDIAAVQVDSGVIAVEGCQFNGGASSATAGVGDITGSGNHVASNIDPGDVPVDR